MDSAPLNIIVSGVGGQGTVLAGKLLSHCALAGGAFVRSAETIGMAQRGGSVLGHVRICEAAVACNRRPTSPLVPKGQAQLLIGFEPAETLRAYSYCDADCVVVSAIEPLLPPTASLQKLNYDGSKQLAALEKERGKGLISKLVLVDNQAVMTTLGFEKALNVVLLGAALAALKSSKYTTPLLNYGAMQEVIKQTVKPRFVEPNLLALETGYQLSCT